MKETYDFSKHKQLEKFVNILSENFGTSLSAITSQDSAVYVTETYEATVDVILEDYNGQTIVTAKEDNTHFEVGLLIKTREVTMLADFMLAGDGESKDTLDDDVKDAVKELSSQLLSSLNVPTEYELKKKFAVKVDNASYINTEMTSSFQGIEYFVCDFTGNVGDKSISFRYFMDIELSTYLDSVPQQAATAGAAAGAAGEGMPAGGQGAAHQQHGVQNLDLLLDIDIPISVRMGSARLFLKDILGLGPGNIVELEQNADEPIELAINDKVIARGEVVIVDGYFGFRIKEIISKAERIKKLKD